MPGGARVARGNRPGENQAPGAVRTTRHPAMRMRPASPPRAGARPRPAPRGWWRWRARAGTGSWPCWPGRGPGPSRTAGSRRHGDEGHVGADSCVGPGCSQRRPSGQQHGQEQHAAQSEDRAHRRAGGYPAPHEAVRGPGVDGVGRPSGQAQAHAEHGRPGGCVAGMRPGGFGQAQRHDAGQAQGRAEHPAGRQPAPVDDAFGQRRRQGGRAIDTTVPTATPARRIEV